MVLKHPPLLESWSYNEDIWISPNGFREYDCRWRYPEDINLLGLTEVGKAIGTYINELGKPNDIVVGCDFRSYSPAVKNALVLGLFISGMRVIDIGTVVSPMAYYARVRLGVPNVCMITASHNPNGWTGIKVGIDHPFTLSAEDITALKELIFSAKTIVQDGGQYTTYKNLADEYLHHLTKNVNLTRKIKAVCATGNGTASKFAVSLLDRMGVDTIPLHAEPNSCFPNYNPNPEALVMLEDMQGKVRKTKADLAFGFDGDGDRLGVVDNQAEEIYSDKLGLIMARSLSKRMPGAKFVADVKSTGIITHDPELQKNGALTEFYKTGHGHMKRRVYEVGAVLGIEKSGHFYFSPPVGFGFDCAFQAAVEVCKLLDNSPGKQLSDLKDDLPRTWSSPTMSPYCDDNEKYGVVDRITSKLKAYQEENRLVDNKKIVEIMTLNGARVILENNSWFLVRASSNTPNLVIVCESTASRRELENIFGFVREVLQSESLVGAFDQTLD